MTNSQRLANKSQKNERFVLVGYSCSVTEVLFI